MFDRELNPNRCQTRVYGTRDVVGYQCNNKPVVTRDGKLYCKIHDPKYLKEKDARRRAKLEREDLKRRKAWDLKQARNDATKGLTLQELRRVTPELIRKALISEYIRRSEMWDNLKKNEINTLVKFHNQHPERSKNEAHTPNYDYPNGIFYRRACEMMGIDPDSNPNYK